MTMFRFWNRQYGQAALEGKPAAHHIVALNWGNGWENIEEGTFAIIHAASSESPVAADNLGSDVVVYQTQTGFWVQGRRDALIAVRYRAQ